ncbi:MAG: T9SS type A sorting domain-containing protein [Candidatus Krumholzibacteriales bacterium]
MDKIKLIAVLFLISMTGFAAGSYGADPASIQLVGNFNGITCHPEDPENNMTYLGESEWIKLQFIDEPGAPPDTIDFKFTMNGDFFPEHWGWSHEYGWGIAALGYSPPMIVTALPDSGYYYFHFNSSTYAYSLERPESRVFGDLTSDVQQEQIANAEVALMDSLGRVLGTCRNFSGTRFDFNNLPPATYSLYAGAPGYRDTTATGIELPLSDSVRVDICLSKTTATMITWADCRRMDNSAVLRWSATIDPGVTGFDIYRGTGPDLLNMNKRNSYPVTSNGSEYSFRDSGLDPSYDYYYYILETDNPGGAGYGPLKLEGIAFDPNRLGQNYPNPFNPSTNIPFTLGTENFVRIAFYDASGRIVSKTDLGYRQAGEYTFTWNASISNGGHLPSGVYYCKLSVGKKTYTRKMVLLR